jgi:hypothetical protein
VRNTDFKPFGPRHSQVRWSLAAGMLEQMVQRLAVVVFVQAWPSKYSL